MYQFHGIVYFLHIYTYVLCSIKSPKIPFQPRVYSNFIYLYSKYDLRITLAVAWFACLWLIIILYIMNVESNKLSPGTKNAFEFSPETTDTGVVGRWYFALPKPSVPSIASPPPPPIHLPFMRLGGGKKSCIRPWFSQCY